MSDNIFKFSVKIEKENGDRCYPPDLLTHIFSEVWSGIWGMEQWFAAMKSANIDVWKDFWKDGLSPEMDDRRNPWWEDSVLADMLRMNDFANNLLLKFDDCPCHYTIEPGLITLLTKNRVSAKLEYRDGVLTFEFYFYDLEKEPLQLSRQRIAAMLFVAQFEGAKELLLTELLK